MNNQIDLFSHKPASQAKTPAFIIDPQQAKIAADIYRLDQLKPRTVRAYKIGWNIYNEWCASNGHDPLQLSVQQYEHFIVQCAENYKMSTLYIIVAAIKFAFNNNSEFPDYAFTSPRIDSLMKGIRQNKIRKDEVNKAACFNMQEFRQLLKQTSGGGQNGLRTRTFMLLLFWCAFRGEEMLQMKVEDIQSFDGAWCIRVPKQKNHSKPMFKAVPDMSHDPLLDLRSTLKLYIDTFKLQAEDHIASVFFHQSGAFFKRPAPMIHWNLQKIMKNHFSKLYGEEIGCKFSLHSFRRSFVTWALDQPDCKPDDVCTQTHQTLATVLEYDENKHKIERNWLHRKFNAV